MQKSELQELEMDTAREWEVDGNAPLLRPEILLDSLRLLETAM